MKLSRTQTITICNNKGGVGKTTTAVNLAHGFAEAGYKACLVDLDPQCNATDHCAVDLDDLRKAGGLTVLDAFLRSKPSTDIVRELDGDSLGLIPGNRGLTSVETALEAEMQKVVAEGNSSMFDQDDIKAQHRQRLSKSLSALHKTFDVIVIDTPPMLGFLTASALIASDWYILPLTPSGYDLRGLEAVTATAAKAQKRLNPRLRLLGVLVSRYQGRAKLDKDILESLGDQFGDKLFKTRIHDSVRHRESTIAQESIYTHAPDHAAAQLFRELTAEILTQLVDLDTKLVDLAAEKASTSEPELVKEVAANE